MGIRSPWGGLSRFTRYDTPTDFGRWHAMALASLVPPSEDYVLGIDCADRWLFRWWGTKLVLTSERVAAFTADPANPMKQTYWLDDITEITYETGLLTDELRLIGADFYEGYAVPKALGCEFAEAVRTWVDETRTQ